MNRHRILLQKFLYPFLIFILCAGVGCLLYVLHSSFRIKSVTVIGNIQDLTGLDKLDGKNLLLLDENELKHSLLSTNFGIENISVKKNYPDSINISLKLKEGQMLLIGSPSAFLVSADGRVLSRVDDPSYYQMLHVNDPMLHPLVGDILSGDIVSLFVLSQKLRKNNISIDQIDIDPSGQEATIVLSDDTKVKLLTGKSATSLATPLQIIITRFRIEGRSPLVIDFRFTRPIVTFRNGEKISP